MMESGIEVGAVFFDLTKAIDSVPHKALIEKLQAIGLDGYLIQWTTDYFTHRKQYVSMVHHQTLSLLFLACLRDLSWDPCFFSSTSMALQIYLYHLRARQSCMLTIFCYTGY